MSIQFIFIISLFSFFCPQNNRNCNQINLLCNYVYWEDLTDNQKDDILNSEEVNREVVAFYQGNLKIGDNNQTINLLDTLSFFAKKEKISALYFFLFNQICINADGALAEMIGSYCQTIILNSPTYVINYFSNNEHILKIYAQYLGYELYFKEKGTSDIEYNYEDFKKLLSDKMENLVQYEEILKLFYDEIEKTMKNMD